MLANRTLCILIGGWAWLSLSSPAAQSQQTHLDLDVSRCDQFEAELRRSVSLTEVSLVQRKEMRDRFAAIVQRREELNGKVDPRARQMLERMDARLREAEEKLKQKKQQLIEYQWQGLRR